VNARRPPIPEGPYLIVGLARSGQAAARALAAAGARVIAVDAGAPSGAHALADDGVELHLGEEGAELLDRAHVVVKSPGVPPQAPVIAAAHERGAPVMGELELGWRMLPNEFIAVTGTNGKTTTAELIGHIHRQAVVPAVVAGNVGTALTTLVGEVDADAVIVCEVSSFQLEDADAFAPQAAVLVNLTTDHLDRHGSREAYVEAKLRVFANQRDGDLAVAPSELLEGTLDQSEGPVRAQIGGAAARVGFGSGSGAALRERDGALWWQDTRLLGTEELSLRGRHNVENAMAAAAACLARGIAPDAVSDGLRTFTGVRHRLEEVARLGGVRFINDSKATNVASTIVALEALAPAAAIHVILGGQAKGQDFSPLRSVLQQGRREAYLIGEDAGVIERALRGAGVPLHSCGDLEHALARARGVARDGEVVLLSPACASFDQFADFEARGERFRQLVCAEQAR
jgi:UDP-N-acetylmuramoylalanine--D-glutamate ligase